jgi:hypothetical protein
MKKNILGFILLGIAILILVFGLVMLKTRFSSYAIVAYVAAAIVGFVGIYYVITNSNPKVAYESAVRSVLNTYDSVLVQSNQVPKLDGRNIVYIGTMDDLIDAQLEIRKPICYVKQSESCSFILLDEKEAYIHIMKLSMDVLSPLEIEIKENELKVKNKDEMDAEMLKEIERTTIVRLSNQRSYKVSPIRKKQLEDQREDIQAAAQEFQTEEAKTPEVAPTVEPQVEEKPAVVEETPVVEEKEPVVEEKKEEPKSDYFDVPVMSPIEKKEEKNE